MLARLVLLAVSLVVAATASANPLIGVWESDREIELRLTEGSTRLSYRIVATGSDFVEIEYDDEKDAKAVGGLLHVPDEDMGFHEIFRRIDAPAAPAP
jgi:hypothetical protein